MKQKIKLFKESGLFMVVVMLLCSFVGVADIGAMTADVVPGANAGVTETNQINSTQFSRENSEDLLLNDIEKKVVKIRPMGNPLEQLSRYATRRSATSQIQQYYATDVLPVMTTLKTAYTAPGTGEDHVTIDTNNNNIFSAKETIIFPEVLGYDETGTLQTEVYFQAYITKKADDKKLILKAVNGQNIGGVMNSIPSLPANTPILRCGRAHNEVDIQTPAYAQVPTKSTQFLQIFKCQIEETTLQKIANKEVEWNFNDLEEEAIFDMKRGMNKNFLLGAKALIYDDDERAVYMTGGIYWQAKKKFVYGDASSTQITFDELVKLSEVSFTGNAGNKEKVFLVGSGLLTNLSLIKYEDTQKPSNTTFVKYGITFKEITTNFGTLWVVHDESFDEAGMYDKGLIIDIQFLRKYSIHELKALDLDLRKSGDRNVDARTIEEISGLVLQNPEAHIRVEKFA
ncbi:MAG: DUF5309 family protein [Dysgonomonas sp.]